MSDQIVYLVTHKLIKPLGIVDNIPGLIDCVESLRHNYCYVPEDAVVFSMILNDSRSRRYSLVSPELYSKDMLNYRVCLDNEEKWKVVCIGYLFGFNNYKNKELHEYYNHHTFLGGFTYQSIYWEDVKASSSENAVWQVQNKIIKTRNSIKR